MCQLRRGQSPWNPSVVECHERGAAQCLGSEEER
jgi:hypothetical protein